MLPEILSYVCPFCDCEVRVGEPCPGCAKKAHKKAGSSKATKRPWEQDPSSDGLVLPDNNFNYEEFAAREFGNAPHRMLGLKWYWWLLGIVVLFGMLVSAFWLR